MEDEQYQVGIVEKMIEIGFGPCEFVRFTNSKTVADTLEHNVAIPDLVILDLLIPAGGFETTHAYPGIEVLSSLTAKYGSEVGIIVRSGLGIVPDIGEADHVVVVPKASTPQELIVAAAAMLAPKGFHLKEAVVSLPDGSPMGAGQWWLSPLVLSVGAAIAASAWIAQLVPVIAQPNVGRDRIAIASAIASGVCIGASRMHVGWGRLTLQCLSGAFIVGSLVVVMLY